MREFSYSTKNVGFPSLCTILRIQPLQAADISKWPVGIEAHLKHTKKCAEMEKTFAPPPPPSGTQTPLTLAYMEALKTEVCVALQIKASLGSGDSLCPGASPDNFHICYKKVLNALLERKQLTLTGLTLMQASATMELLKQKKRSDSAYQLLETVLTTVDAVKQKRKTRDLLTPANRTLVQESEILEFETLDGFTDRKLAKKLLETGEKAFAHLGKEETSPALQSWRSDLRRRLDRSEAQWKYPDPNLETEAEIFEKSLAAKGTKVPQRIPTSENKSASP